jgi:prophage tail gpP-like protein
MSDTPRFEVTLEVDGRIYGGWQEVLVRRGIEQIAGTFELTVTDRWHGQEQAWPIREGAACTLTYGADVLITGYVDDVLPSFDAADHSITVVGRDKTGDLVDCSAVAGTGQWRGRTLAQVAEAICRPFGITVRDEAAATEKFTTAALQESETAFEAIERACRMRGVLPISDGQGALVLTRAGTQTVPTALKQGENILSGRATFSMRDRYSDYVCKGQNIGDDDSTPAQNAQARGTASDGRVAAMRYRPLVIVAEDVGTNRTLADRAVWEAAVRMGRSARPMLTVQGWRHAAGLWLPNTLARVTCPFLYLDDVELLVVAVTYRISEAGTLADIELCKKEAFDMLAVAEPAANGGDNWWS